MKMLWIVLRRELQEGATNFTLFCALAALTLFIPLSAYVQAHRYQQLLEDRTSRQVLRPSEMHEQVTVISRPVPPLFSIFNGLYGRLPDEVTLALGSVSAAPSIEDLRPLDALSPTPDLSTIIGLIVTLMAVLLTHDAVVGERQRGTLRLILSAPIARRMVLTAKLVGALLLTGVVLLYGVALYVILVTILGGGVFELSAQRLLELTLITTIAFLSAGVFTTLGIAISTLVRTASAALTLSLAAWVAAIVIWPSLAPLLAASLRPVSPNQVFRRELLTREQEVTRGELSEHREMAAALRAQNADVETGWNAYLEIKRRWNARRRERIERVIHDRERHVEQQQRMTLGLLSISPYGAFQTALGDLCGTGPEDYRMFLEAVRRYDAESFIPQSFAAFARDKPWIQAPDHGEPFRPPPFSAPARSMKERVRAIRWPVSLLLMEWGFLVALAYLRFDRYDVR
jgi:ABC-type transport system involved in multi-copper enzyme maturation permease subunit